MVAHACNSSTWEVGTEGSQVQGHKLHQILPHKNGKENDTLGSLHTTEYIVTKEGD